MTIPTPKKQGQKKDQLLFLGSGLLLVIIVLAAFAKAQRWGTRFIDVYLKTRDVSGLKQGEDIRIAGIVAGLVGPMDLNDQGEVKVRLKIQANKIHLIGPSSRASLAQEGLISSSYLAITADPQPKEQSLDMKGRTISYEQPINVNTLLKQLATSQQQLNVTLENTNALTAEGGSLNTALNATRDLAKSLQNEIAKTAPVMRESISNVAEDVRIVSESTTAVEDRTLSLIEETQPLIVETLKDADELTRSSQNVIDMLTNVFGTWLEPLAGSADGMSNQN